MCRMRQATRDVRGNRGCHARASGHPVPGERAIRAGAALLGTGRRLLDRPPARTMTAGGLGDVQVEATARAWPPHCPTRYPSSPVHGTKRADRWPPHPSRRVASQPSMRRLRKLPCRMRRKDHRRRVAVTSGRVSSSHASPSRRRSAATCRNARRSATSRRRP